MKKQSYNPPLKSTRSATHYLDHLTLEDLELHTFQGYRLKVTTLSGKEHVVEVYYKGRAINGYYLNGLLDKKTLRITDSLEISTRYIEQVECLEKLEQFIIGPNARITFERKHLGYHGSLIFTISKERMYELLELDHNETKSYKRKS